MSFTEIQAENRTNKLIIYLSMHTKHENKYDWGKYGGGTTERLNCMSFDKLNHIKSNSCPGDIFLGLVVSKFFKGKYNSDTLIDFHK